jgi:hypothetical protein
VYKRRVRGPEDWDPRGLIPLKTPALDNHGHQYSVFLERKSGDGMYPTTPEGNWILGIEGAPGHWYMGTLLEGEKQGHFRGGRISLDFGQKWDCINFDEVLAEAKEVLKLG